MTTRLAKDVDVVNEYPTLLLRVARYRRMPYPFGPSRHQFRRSPHRVHFNAREIVSNGVRIS